MKAYIFLDATMYVRLTQLNISQKCEIKTLISTFSPHNKKKPLENYCKFPNKRRTSIIGRTPTLDLVPMRLTFMAKPLI